AVASPEVEPLQGTWYTVQWTEWAPPTSPNSWMYGNGTGPRLVVTGKRAEWFQTAQHADVRDTGLLYPIAEPVWPHARRLPNNSSVIVPTSTGAARPATGTYILKKDGTLLLDVWSDQGIRYTMKLMDTITLHNTFAPPVTLPHFPTQADKK